MLRVEEVLLEAIRTVVEALDASTISFVGGCEAGAVGAAIDLFVDLGVNHFDLMLQIYREEIWC